MTTDRQRQDVLSPVSLSCLVIDKTIVGRKWRIKRFCYACGVDRTRIKSGGYAGSFYDWFLNKDENGEIIHYLCAKCADRYIRRPKRKDYFDIKNVETHRIFGPKRINLQGKIRIQLDHNPRTGYCSLCLNNIYDGSCKKTDLHHIEYDLDNPLRYTIELCPSCHGKETKAGTI